MKKIKEWLKNKSYQKWEWWIECFALAYVMWAAVVYIMIWFDLGTKVPEGTVDMTTVLTATFVFFAPFVLGFLLGKVYNKGE